MSWRERTPELVVGGLLVALVLAFALLGGGERTGTASEHAGQVTPERVARIADRVERLRGLRFLRPVEVEVVAAAEARRVGLAELARTQTAQERRADEDLLKLLGLLPEDASMQAITEAIFAEQVAGFYDPRRDRLALVRGAGVDDITLAHELVHALEDQHFDLERLGDGPGDDRAAAEQALAEGTATRVMQDYAARWPSDAPLGDALAGLAQFTTSTPLPAYTMRSLIFPYLQGERFVSALRDAARGDWRLVDLALASRPPVTTAEILAADRWLRAEQPQAVALHGAAVLPAAGSWRRLVGSTLGAEPVAALLSPTLGPSRGRTLTAGWRGGRYAFWRRGPAMAPGCAAPCRPRSAVELAVRMETARQARDLAAGLRRWLAALPSSSAGAVSVDGRVVRAALAPTPALARQLAGP